ncbi:hypothetical protein ACMFMG_003334 [Clarireedia jacksonii]
MGMDLSMEAKGPTNGLQGRDVFPFPFPFPFQSSSDNIWTVFPLSETYRRATIIVLRKITSSSFLRFYYYHHYYHPYHIRPFSLLLASQRADIYGNACWLTFPLFASHLFVSTTTTTTIITTTTYHQPSRVHVAPDKTNNIFTSHLFPSLPPPPAPHDCHLAILSLSDPRNSLILPAYLPTTSLSPYLPTSLPPYLPTSEQVPSISFARLLHYFTYILVKVNPRGTSMNKCFIESNLEPHLLSIHTRQSLIKLSKHQSSIIQPPQLIPIKSHPNPNLNPNPNPNPIETPNPNQTPTSPNLQPTSVRPKNLSPFLITAYLLINPRLSFLRSPPRPTTSNPSKINPC